MVAKSFKDFEILCEPFEKSGRLYVNVRNPKTQKERTVRYYTEAEYYKLYPEEAKETNVVSAADPHYRPLREVLGFEKGYITIFKGEILADIEDYFKLETSARYSTRWGWYIPSDTPIPQDVPSSLNPIQLNWDSIAIDQDTLKSNAQIEAIVGALLFDAHPSQHIGTIGQRIEIEITVINNIKVENDYGTSTIMVFEDAQRNQFVWITSAKSWEIGVKKRIRGTIKEHRSFRNTNQTVLQRCMEVN